MTFECLVLLEGWGEVSLQRIKEEMQAGRVVGRLQELSCEKHRYDAA